MDNRLAGMLVAVAVLATSGVASAQTARDEYGDLVRRATEGAQTIDDGRIAVPEEREAVVAPKPKRVAQRETTQVERSDAEYLHQSSEYADEPHKVRVVDRSRYDAAFVPTNVSNTIGLPQGSILVDVKARQLYFALSPNVLRRYGVAVGKAGKAWHGTATVGRTARWPDWHPTANIRRENRRLKARVPGGASNPLGARAIYLYAGGRDTLYRIHGTNVPSSIGKFASHGCIRMINEDVIELHSMVRPGATVIVR
jgi:lipoprotein-anchoring transpeptidase ErfK/SrfK